MDLDSVELLDKINSSLTKINARLDKIDTRLDKVDPVPEPDTPRPNLDVENIKTDYLSVFMNQIGLANYHSRVDKHVESKRQSSLENWQSILKGIVGEHGSSQPFYRTMTPIISCNLAGIITVTLFFRKGVDDDTKRCHGKMMKQLVKYCYDEKYWDQLEYEIKIEHVYFADEGMMTSMTGYYK